MSRVFFFSIRLTIVSCCSFCFFYFNSKLFRIRGFKISSVDYVISIYGDSDFEGEKKNKCLVFNSLLLSLPLCTGPKVLYPIAFQKEIISLHLWCSRISFERVATTDEVNDFLFFIKKKKEDDFTMIFFFFNGSRDGLMCNPFCLVFFIWGGGERVR